MTYSKGMVMGDFINVHQAFFECKRGGGPLYDSPVYTGDREAAYPAERGF